MPAEQLQTVSGVSKWFFFPTGDGASSTTPYSQFPLVDGTGTASLTSTISDAVVITNLQACAKLFVQVRNGSGAALNAFVVETRGRSSSTWIPRLNAAAHFLAPIAESILRASAGANGSPIDPTTLPVNALIDMEFDLRDFLCSDLRIRASTASTTIVTVDYQAR